MPELKKLLRENRISFIYLAIAVVLELSASFFVGARPFFTRFWIPLLLCAIIVFALFVVKNKKAKRITTFVLLVVQVATVVASGYLYASNGSAFTKEMLNMRSDAFGTIEQFNLSIWLILICIAALALHLSILLRERKKARAAIAGGETLMPESRDKEHTTDGRLSGKTLRRISLVMCLVCTAIFCITPVLNGAAEKKQPNYHYKLTNSGDGNQKYGVTSNIVYELLRFGGSAGINLDDIDEVGDYLYADASPTSAYHGISEGNNLLFILAESFDTHVLERYSRDDTAKIFPNISRIMDEGVYFDNFRQKEKTDVSELISLVGSYPTEKYINYSYENNAYPYSLPTLFRDNSGKSEDEIQIMSFHQNQGSFYNRDDLHKTLGFEEFVSIEDMLDYGMVNDWDRPGRFTKGERSLDSLTAETMKDLMLPADKQFFSYWISFTMHGFYEERENLAEQGYYDILDNTYTEDGGTFFPKSSKDENYWRTYAAAVMDFDRALGTILDDLQGKGILDSTTIVIMPDHNTYYNSLTDYAKGLTNRLDTEGFRLPLMIYDQKLAAAFSQQEGLAADESRVVDKFVTGSDVMPTVCDLFGIKLWDNMFFGSTAFGNDHESVAYSRIYNFFFNDHLAFFSAESLDFTAEDFTDSDLDEFLERAKVLLDKVYYMDKVYYSDYFADHDYFAPN